MPYRDNLNRWIVVRLLPKMQRIVVARCRNESDADGYVRILRRLMLEAAFIVVFDGDLPTETQEDLISSANFFLTAALPPAQTS